MKTTNKHTRTRPTSTCVWLSGAICGHLWMPAVMGGLPINATARGPWGFWDKGDSFRDALLSLLCRKGGDFQDSRFTADTVLKLEMTIPSGSPYRWSVRTREFPLSALKDCADLINPEAYTSDFCE